MAWFKSWFNSPYYHLLYKNRDFNEAEIFISKLVEDLKIPKASFIIDLACGKGRHSIFLNKLGYNVLGLDLSEESILHNKQFETKPGESPSLKFEIHDMRDQMDVHQVDAVFNLFTSFGYFEDPEDDNRVFQSVKEALKEDGIFVLDFLNEMYVEKNLVEKYDEKRENITFHIEKKIENHHVIKDISFTDEGEKYHFQERVKLHSLEEIDNFARKNNFERIKVYGNYHLSPFDLETSPRCINVFRKTI